MKKICAKKHFATAPRPDAGLRIDQALALPARNGKRKGIHPAGDWRSMTPRDPRAASASVLEDLAAALLNLTEADHPRTYKLLQSSPQKLSRKLIEEACEVTVEVVKRDPAGVVRESADLLYQMVVLWFHIGIEPIEIWEEMQMRADALGIAEKRPKTAVSKTLTDKFNR
jgi:phosphoribosyl-ATP pyrophosphohydrolase